MVALKRDCEESNAIVKFVENSGCESTVMQMFKVKTNSKLFVFLFWLNIKVYREADVESLVSSDIENHKLLWMPTSLTNVLYTLAKGTVVPCPQVLISHHWFESYQNCSFFRAKEKITHLDTEKDWINLTMTHSQSFMKCSKIWNQNVKHSRLRRSMHSYARYVN